MTLSNLFNFPTEQGTVKVQRGMAMENQILAWCLEYDDEIGPVIEVPAHDWQARDQVIGVWAPELVQEGGIRGLRCDTSEEHPHVEGVWGSPVAPTKRADIQRTALTLERDLRRKGWIAQQSNGKTAYWEHWRSEQPELSLAQYLTGYRTVEEAEADSKD